MVQALAQTLYADIDELRARIRLETLLRCLDWNNDGVLDTAPLDAIRVPASADIDAALVGSAGVYPKSFTAPFPPKLVEIATNGMVYRVGMMYPTHVVIEWETIMKKVEKDLLAIRKGQMSLGVSPPDPAKNHGGRLFPMPCNNPGPIFSGKKGKWGIL